MGEADSKNPAGEGGAQRSQTSRNMGESIAEASHTLSNADRLGNRGMARGESIAEVAAIAAKLTKIQRKAVVDRHGTVSVCRNLRRKGIAERVDGTGMAWSAYPELSPLGIALRTHLISQGADHGR